MDNSTGEAENSRVSIAHRKSTYINTYVNLYAHTSVYRDTIIFPSDRPAMEKLPIFRLNSKLRRDMNVAHQCASR